eukprot:gene11718-34447_t
MSSKAKQKKDEGWVHLLLKSPGQKERTNKRAHRGQQPAWRPGGSRLLQHADGGSPGKESPRDIDLLSGILLRHPRDGSPTASGHGVESSGHAKVGPSLSHRRRHTSDEVQKGSILEATSRAARLTQGVPAYDRRVTDTSLGGVHGTLMEPDLNMEAARPEAILGGNTGQAPRLQNARGAKNHQPYAAKHSGRAGEALNGAPEIPSAVHPALDTSVAKLPAHAQNKPSAPGVGKTASFTKIRSEVADTNQPSNATQVAQPGAAKEAPRYTQQSNLKIKSLAANPKSALAINLQKSREHGTMESSYARIHGPAAPKQSPTRAAANHGQRSNPLLTEGMGECVGRTPAHKGDTVQPTWGTHSSPHGGRTPAHVGDAIQPTSPMRPVALINALAASQGVQGSTADLLDHVYDVHSPLMAGTPVELSTLVNQATGNGGHHSQESGSRVMIASRSQNSKGSAGRATPVQTPDRGTLHSLLFQGTSASPPSISLISTPRGFKASSAGQTQEADSFTGPLALRDSNPLASNRTHDPHPHPVQSPPTRETSVALSGISMDAGPQGSMVISEFNVTRPEVSAAGASSSVCDIPRCSTARQEASSLQYGTAACTAVQSAALEPPKSVACSSASAAGSSAHAAKDRASKKFTPIHQAHPDLLDGLPPGQAPHSSITPHSMDSAPSKTVTSAHSEHPPHQPRDDTKAWLERQLQDVALEAGGFLPGRADSEHPPHLPRDDAKAIVERQLQHATLDDVEAQGKAERQLRDKKVGPPSHKDVSASPGGTAEVKAGTAEVKAGTAEVKACTAEVKAGTAEVKAGTAEVNAGTAEVKAGADANHGTDVNAWTAEVNHGTDVKAVTDVKARADVKHGKPGQHVKRNVMQQEQEKQSLSDVQQHDKGTGVHKAANIPRGLVAARLRGLVALSEAQPPAEIIATATTNYEAGWDNERSSDSPLKIQARVWNRMSRSGSSASSASHSGSSASSATHSSKSQSPDYTQSTAADDEATSGVSGRKHRSASATSVRELSSPGRQPTPGVTSLENACQGECLPLKNACHFTRESNRRSQTPSPVRCLDRIISSQGSSPRSVAKSHNAASPAPAAAPAAAPTTGLHSPITPAGRTPQEEAVGGGSETVSSTRADESATTSHGNADRGLTHPPPKLPPPSLHEWEPVRQAGFPGCASLPPSPHSQFSSLNLVSPRGLSLTLASTPTMPQPPLNLVSPRGPTPSCTPIGDGAGGASHTLGATSAKRPSLGANTPFGQVRAGIGLTLYSPTLPSHPSPANAVGVATTPEAAIRRGGKTLLSSASATDRRVGKTLPSSASATDLSHAPSPASPLATPLHSFSYKASGLMGPGDPGVYSSTSASPLDSYLRLMDSTCKVAFGVGITASPSQSSQSPFPLSKQESLPTRTSAPPSMEKTLAGDITNTNTYTTSSTNSNTSTNTNSCTIVQNPQRPSDSGLELLGQPRNPLSQNESSVGSTILLDPSTSPAASALVSPHPTLHAVDGASSQLGHQQLARPSFSAAFKGLSETSASSQQQHSSAGQQAPSSASFSFAFGIAPPALGSNVSSPSCNGAAPASQAALESASSSRHHPQSTTSADAGTIQHKRLLLGPLAAS